MAKLIRNKSFTEIRKLDIKKSFLKFNVKYMLKQAIGRLGRLTKHFKENAQIIRNNKELYEINADDINDMTKNELASLLSRLNKFTQSKSSTIKGYKQARRETIQQFKDSGMDFVNDNNLDDLLEFLDDFKNSKDAELYGSGDLIKYFEQADRLGISIEDLKDNIDLFEDNFRQIENLDIDYMRREYGEDLSSRDIKDALGIKY